MRNVKFIVIIITFFALFGRVSYGECEVKGKYINKQEQLVGLNLVYEDYSYTDIDIDIDKMNFYLKYLLIGVGVIIIICGINLLKIRSIKKIKPYSDCYYFYSLNYDMEKYMGKIEPALVGIMYREDKYKILRLILIDLLGSENLKYEKENILVHNTKELEGCSEIFIKGFMELYPNGINICYINKVLKGNEFNFIYEDIRKYYKEYIIYENSLSLKEHLENLKLDILYWKGLGTIFQDLDYLNNVEKLKIMNITEVYQLALDCSLERLFHNFYPEEVENKRGVLPFYNELYKPYKNGKLIDYLLKGEV